MAQLDKIALYNNGDLQPLNYQETYIATKHVQQFPLEYGNDLINNLKNRIKTAGLYFDDLDRLVNEIVAGLMRGNIILQGPPGTGKTTLSTIICDSFNVDGDMITAVPDWTTYDTIGGLQPAVDDEGNEIIAGKDGRVVESIVKCCETILNEKYYGGEKQASWLIIDELNRSETDKVFGDLFTVFGSNDLDKKKLQLWFENDENKKTVYVPNRYRLIGIINNVDKNFVNELSHGLSRRFTFINVLPPKAENMLSEIEQCKAIIKKSIPKRIGSFSGNDISEDLIQKIYDDDDFKTIENKTIDIIKELRYQDEDGNGLGLLFGTAQILDLYETIIIRLLIEQYWTRDGDKEKVLKNTIDDAMNGRIIPQLDGYDYEKLKAFVEDFSSSKKWMVNSIKSMKLMVEV